MALQVVIAVDLGTHPVVCCVLGTWDSPVLLEWRAFDAWGPPVLAYIDDLIARRGATVLAVEQTFSIGSGPKRDVGRQQESQAGFLEGMYGGRLRFERVSTVEDSDALIAWQKFGRPRNARGKRVPEHVRDCLGVGLRAINVLTDHRPPEVIAALNRESRGRRGRRGRPGGGASG